MSKDLKKQPCTTITTIEASSHPLSFNEEDTVKDPYHLPASQTKMVRQLIDCVNDTERKQEFSSLMPDVRSYNVCIYSPYALQQAGS